MQPNSDIITQLAGADLTGLEGHLVRTSAENTVVAATDATLPILGVLVRGAASGQAVSVQIAGQAAVKASGAITAGGAGVTGLVTGGALGKAAAYAAPGAGVTNNYLGHALESSVADGEFINVVIRPGSNTGT